MEKRAMVTHMKEEVTTMGTVIPVNPRRPMQISMLVLLIVTH